MSSQKTKGNWEGPESKVKQQLADLNNLLFQKNQERISQNTFKTVRISLQRIF
jgi:hypothetical protein